MIKVVIYGAGERGGYIFHHIGEENVLAFIDAESSKINKLYKGKRVISVENYINEYKESIIIVSTHEEEVIKKLLDLGITHFLKMSECPEDFQSPNPRDILKNYITRNLTLKKKYYILGCTLYSLVLYDWIKEKGCDCTLVIGKSCDKNIEKRLKEHYKSDVVCFLENIQDVDEVYSTSDEKLDDYIIKEYNQCIKPILRISEHIEEYFNYEIKKYHKINKGKRCFIIATGPSLKTQDLEMLKKNNEICISMNGIYKIFGETSWRPQYYITTDKREVMGSSIDFKNDLNKSICFIADTNQEFMEQDHPDNVHIFHLGKIWKEEGFIPFSEDFSKIAYNTATVTYAAMELAVYIGCDEIYLLGVDATGINESYKKYNHFHKESTLVSTCFGKQVLVSYNSAKKYADKHDVEIYNATRGGELEVFERVNFDDLFELS